jgi:cytochrome c553
MHWLATSLPALAATVLGALAPGEPIDFAHDVLPLLRARCARCHTAGEHKGDVSMDTRAALIGSQAVVPGDSSASPLIERVTSGDPAERMPPKADPLTEKEIAVLRAWIDEGVAWQEGFSFAKASYMAPLKPRRPELPPAHDGRTSGIDRIVDAYFDQHGDVPPEAIDDSAFIRRLSLDVIGLLPAPEELDAFVADAAPDKRAQLIARLLGNRRAYAEHWLTFWNDLLRNDYQGTGYIDGGRRAITGWLYRALLDNEPYDQFVRDLISPTPESEGFIKGIKWRGNVNASQATEIQFAQNISQVFLGINMKCASCHDSFIDNWKLADAYGLAAIIADTPPEIHRCDKPSGVTARAKFVFPELGDIDTAEPRNERLRRTAELMTHPENGRFARTIVNRIWQRLMGRGIVQPVDVMSNEPWSVDLLDYLATQLADSHYDLKKAIELIVSSRAYQSRCVPPPDPGSGDYIFRGPIAQRMTAEQFLDAVYRITGTAPEKPAADFGDRDGDPVRAALVAADPLMRSLGRPNREQIVTTRPEELSTLQALDLTNGAVMAELVERGAKNLSREDAGDAARELVDRLYRAALCRRPTDAELETALNMVGSPVTAEGLSDLFWAVFMLPEFQFIQ